MRNNNNDSSKFKKRNKQYGEVPSVWKTNRKRRKTNYNPKFNQNYDEQTIEMSENYDNENNYNTEINSDIKTLYEDNYKSYLIPQKNKYRKFIFSILVIFLLSIFLTIYLYFNNNELFNPLKNSNGNSGNNDEIDNTNKIKSTNSDISNGKNQEKTYTNSTIENIIGINKEKITKNFGEPDRVDKNEYSQDLSIYNNDYNNFTMISYSSDNICTSFFTMSENYLLYDSFKIGSSKKDIKSVLKENNYTVSEADENIWINNEYELDLFYNKENILSSFQIYTLPDSKAITFDENINNEEINNYLSLQMFDLINVTRLKNGKSEIKFSTKASKVAYNHSKDMMENNYFSHDDLEGVKPFERLTNAGIECTKVSENISAGHRNSVFVIETLMKSDEHKNNILGDFEYIGIGTIQGGKHRIYFTQIYYSNVEIEN